MTTHMKIVLFQPQIPQNTGNIVRTCSVTGCDLLLVEPLGFSITDRWLKRAGLDYWEGVEVDKTENLEAYLDNLENCQKPFYFFSSKAEKFYTDKTVHFPEDVTFIFGSETNGLPDIFFEKWPEKFIKIPMLAGSRCLNLATSCGIAVYEALRQQNYPWK